MLSVAAPAQYTPQREDRYDQATRSNSALMERVRADLDQAEATASAFNGDVARISTAREDLNLFQHRLNEGDYDARVLTETIVSVQRVLDHNPLYSHTRNALTDDLSQLRDLRAGYEY